MGGRVKVGFREQMKEKPVREQDVVDWEGERMAKEVTQEQRG